MPQLALGLLVAARMQLVNTTQVPAQCFVGPGDGTTRIGLLVAKATFELGPGAVPRLTLDHAEPIRLVDEETELGCLPADTTPRRAPSFEVILLGRAHSPHGRRPGRIDVALSIGGRRRELAVFGERTWGRSLGLVRPSAPDVLSSLPLVWEHAFGGSATVWLDARRQLSIHHPLNHRGRGFDPLPSILRLPKELGAAPGYPVTDYVRGLPSIEDPATCIERWDDAPDPCCWATVPRGIGLATLAARRVSLDASEDEALDRLYDRAHPDWIIDVPARGADVRLVGLHPYGDLRFALPQLRVFADYEIGRWADASIGCVELAPRMLLLQPERGTFSILYRKCFTFARLGPGGARTLRLRVEDGWARDAQVCS